MFDIRASVLIHVHNQIRFHVFALFEFRSLFLLILSKRLFAGLCQID